MTLSTITQTPLQLKSSEVVYEYSFKVFNPERQDPQDLTAAFISQPTAQDWEQWLTGWTSCGYRLCSTPQLINTIH
jgi:hypothetical protein